jgi:hypothetical protein
MYCNKTFSYTHGLRRHYLICKQKDIQEIKKKNEELTLQLETIRNQYEKDMKLQKEQYEQQIQNIRELKKHQIQQQQEQLQQQREQIEKLENQIFEIAKQPKQQQITNHNNQSTQTTNNRILNITNNLVPMDLTDEQIRIPETFF